MDNPQPTPQPIPLKNGGSFHPIDTTPYVDSMAYRTDPNTLPDLPAGVSANDLKETLEVYLAESDPEPHRAAIDALRAELAIRTLGYLPQMGPDGFDQFGFDLNGRDSHGKDRNGYGVEETESDPFFEARVPITEADEAPTKYTRQGRRDWRRGNPGNRGNPNGRSTYAADGSKRSIAKCWFDFFAHNEIVQPVKRRTDAEIVQKMATLFPQKEPAELMTRIVRARWMYNRGRLIAQQTTVPELQSYKYSRDIAAGVVYKLAIRGQVVEKFDVGEALAGEHLLGTASGEPVPNAPKPSRKGRPAEPRKITWADEEIDPDVIAPEPDAVHPTPKNFEDNSDGHDDPRADSDGEGRDGTGEEGFETGGQTDG